MHRLQGREQFWMWCAAAALALVAIVGCSSKPKADKASQPPAKAGEMTDEQKREYVSTSVTWVNDELDAAGVKMGADKADLLAYLRQHDYKVCVNNQAYTHILVPNSQLHPGQQDIHVIAAFDTQQKIANLDVTTALFSVQDLTKDCK